MRRTCLVFSLLLLASPALAQEKANPKWKAGDKAPALEAVNGEGKKVTLEELTKKQDFTALVFVRSVAW